MKIDSWLPLRLNTLLGSLCGTIAGFGWGVIFAAMVGMLGQLAHPEDPSSGSGAIIGLATAPFGGMIGLVGGAKYPKASYFAVLPLAIGFIILVMVS